MNDLSQPPFGLEPGIVEHLPPDLFAGIETQILALHRHRAGRRLRDLCFYTGLWAAGAALVVWQMNSSTGGHAAGWFVGVLLAALGLNGFVLLVHEGMHGTLLRAPLANRVASVLLSCTHLMSFTAYQVLHIRHHKNVGRAGDPDHYANYVKSKPVVWLLHGLRLAAAAFLYLIAIPVLACRNAHPAVRWRIAGEYALLALFAAAAVAWVPVDLILWTWFVPMVIVALITQMRAFAQHTLTDASDPLLAARSMRPWSVVSYVMLHENFHLEHHLFPRVPSYNLPSLSRLIEDRLPKVVVGSSYLALIGRFILASRTLDETPVVVRDRALEAERV